MCWSRAGFGTFPGTGLPGEAMGYLTDAQLRYPVVRTSLAYGYGLAVTPLQLASAYLTLASLGERVPVSISQNRCGQGEPESASSIVAWSKKYCS